MKRTIHGITWHDELAWMEDMKGSKWNTHVLKQQEKWNTAVKPLEDTIKILGNELESCSQTLHTMLFRAGGGQVSMGIEGGKSWLWKWTKDAAFAADADNHSTSALEVSAKGVYVWAVDEIGEGAELYAIRMYSKKKGSILWQHEGVGPFLAIVGDRCYCLEAKKSLIYWRVVSWDAKTGKDRRVLYEEEDFRYNLELSRGGYVRRQAGTKEDMFIIRKDHIMTVLEGFSVEPRRFVMSKGEGQGYFIWGSSTGWICRGGLEKYSLPSLEKEIPEVLNLDRGFLVTKWDGLRTLWRISKEKNKKPIILWRGYGSIEIDPWESSWVRIVYMGGQVFWWDSEGSVLEGGLTDCVHKAKSLDGTMVPFLLIPGEGDKGQRAKGLLVVGYGAYGLATPLMTQRWQPLLQRGWAIAIGLWRGGGDRTPEWEDAGRCEGRVRVLEDAEAVVRASRSLVKMKSEKTVLYGRSAGGLWVGGLAAKFPKGDLFGGLYMEVPYLDVLRTITNRDLPLTDIETDEFGLPEQRITDFASVLQWSPMELMPPGGISGVWQIVRTGMNDSEVLAYESVKWIARSKNKMAYLAIEGGQGHFVIGKKGFQQQAEDLAMILNLA